MERRMVHTSEPEEKAQSKRRRAARCNARMGPKAAFGGGCCPRRLLFDKAKMTLIHV